jgi:hypothetical protein
MKDIFTRYNTLVSTKNSADSICSKLNAEFQGCFYRNKNDIWASIVEESKQKIQKLGSVGF